jgi:hypothetical protein
MYYYNIEKYNFVELKWSGKLGATFSYLLF